MTLALYDVVIFCDDSGSMAFEEGGERINDLKVILGRVAEVATLFDSNGINIRCAAGLQSHSVVQICPASHSLATPPALWLGFVARLSFEFQIALL